MSSHDAALIVENPCPIWLRMGLFAAGAFVVCISTWELFRGVFPVNAFSPFFFFLLAGAYSVGFPIAAMGLFGWEDRWNVLPGEIRIDRRNPFSRRQVVISSSALLAIQVTEKESSEGPNTWVVELVRSGGEHFQSRHFGSQAAADRLRGEILAALKA